MFILKILSEAAAYLKGVSVPDFKNEARQRLIIDFHIFL